MSSRELIFQLVLHFLVFIFFSFDRYHPQIAAYQVTYFLTYAVAAAFINYWMLPLFFYRKKYLQFFLSFFLTLGAVIVLEELLWEPIYFPGQRASTFPGVFFSLVQILPVISILVGFKFAWDALGKQREVDELRNTVQESELQFLKSQINPHFLFNNLNNLYAYAIENSPKTPAIILELSSVLRYMLYECREKFVPLSKEIAQLENFTQLNELQIEERGEVRFRTRGNTSGFQIAPLIMIVFIENAFKHSQASQSEDIFIDIEVGVSEQGRLDFYCKNNYHPTSNTASLSQGIGLENVKKRLDLIYPDAHRLDITETEDLYTVHLSIALNQNQQV
ncbi:histidine kinase [Flavilitoribacter nigricans DSM 23189 = NBRC 102662]|uniref:Histidine kinase n=2 Tax=Flavilitoribacter TaxID=2762562 RepID=A0A2D0NE43_FLAN2|nr:histidine kinase [Flavilitoribacter nigricans DSM 23189 = NBRC 102662]